MADVCYTFIMNIAHLHLKNFKCYKDLAFQFDPHFNLFIGENGSGKTSILEALTIAAGSWLLGIRGQDSRNFRKSDIRRTTQFSNKRYLSEPQLPVVVEAEGTVSGQCLTWSRAIEYERGRTSTRGARSIRLLSEQASEHVMNGDRVILPLLSYYSAGRLWLEPRDSTKGIHVEDEEEVRQPQDFASVHEADQASYFISRLAGYRYSVDGRCNFRDLMNWMIYERRGEVDEEERSPYLRNVLEAIADCLPEVDKVKVSLRRKELMVSFIERGWVPASELSDGYRVMLAVVGDIAFKAALLNASISDDILRETPGVVMIDELDLHLHPVWQRRVACDLMRVFPKIQFFCTTHSPQIVGELPQTQVWVLSPTECYNPPVAFGSDSTWLLDHVMGGRSRSVSF